MDPCLDDAAVVAFAEGQLRSEELARAEAHLAECAECRELVSELARADPSPELAVHAVDPLAATARNARDEVKVPPVREGDVLAGKYEVESVLGAGGMGIVVAARDASLGRKVALKFLLPAESRTKGAVLRFLREARAAVRIESEHVARVIDVGTLEHGEPFIVMELLRGTDFARLLQARGPLPVDEAIDFVLQACEALAEAHALGMVHRDIKPANLFLTQRPDGSPLVKVLDFGISKTTETDAGTATSRNVMMGSPRYMSPEQMVSAHDADARTDVWALGLVLFELCTGKAAFESDSIAELCTQVATAPTPPLRAHRPDAPEALEATIFGCLEKDRDKRVQSIGELARRLAPLAPARAQLSVERIRRLEGDAPAAASPTEAPRSSDARPAAKRGPVLAVGLVAALAVMGLAYASGLRGATPAQPSTQPSTTTQPSTSTSTTTSTTTTTSTQPSTSTPTSTQPSAAPSTQPVTSTPSSRPPSPRPSQAAAPSASTTPVAASASAAPARPADESNGLRDRK